MTPDDETERHALDYQERLAMMTDAEIRAAYLVSDAEADDPWRSALAEAMLDRGIDD